MAPRLDRAVAGLDMMLLPINRSFGPPREVFHGSLGLIERRLEFGYEHGLARSFWQATGKNLPVRPRFQDRKSRKRAIPHHGSIEKGRAREPSSLPAPAYRNPPRRHEWPPARQAPAAGCGKEDLVGRGAAA